MKVLEIDNLHAGYGDVDIIKSINIYVDDKEIITISGTNGSGKSTILKSVMGLLKRTNGEIKCRGLDIQKSKVEDRIKLGIAYVPQVQNVFGSLTVLENLKVVGGVDNYKRRIEAAFEMFPILARRSNARAGTLSGGERQQLAFARALMPEPSLVLLDEPSAALAPALLEQVFTEVRKLPAAGAAVLMVEQRARQALAFSDRGYILDNGRIVLTDTAEALINNEDMAKLYLGSVP